MISMDSLLLLVVLIAVVFFIGSFARILREYERGVIFRLGRSARAILNPGGQGNGPGLVLLVPLIDKLVKVSLQTVALDVPPQDVITRDNVSLKVSAVIYFRVIDPERAIIAVQDYLYATSQIAQTTLRSVLGQVELDDLLSARDKINQQLQRIIDGSFGRELLRTLLPGVEAALDRYNWEGAARPRVLAGTIGSDARAIGGALLPLYANFAPDRDLFLKIDKMSGAAR